MPISANVCGPRFSGFAPGVESAADAAAASADTETLGVSAGVPVGVGIELGAADADRVEIGVSGEPLEHVDGESDFEVGGEIWS